MSLRALCPYIQSGRGVGERRHVEVFFAGGRAVPYKELHLRLSRSQPRVSKGLVRACATSVDLT